MEKLYRGKDDRTTHPKEIWDFYEFTIENTMFTSGKISWFQMCLWKTALEWHKAHAPQLQSLAELKQAFLKEYWDNNAQGEMLAKLCKNKFQAITGESRIQYFYRWIRWAKYITLYEMKEEIIIKNLIKHFQQ